MVAIQVRNVPDEVRQALAEQAAARGESLQALLLELLTRESRSGVNTALLRLFEDRTDGSHLSAAELAGVIGEARGERDDRGDSGTRRDRPPGA
jgi:plasmid stability protein